jgi:acetyl-CoA acetyltransferase
MKNREVVILSVGMHPWGVWADKSQAEMAVEAISTALDKIGMNWREIEFICSGSPLWVADREGLNSSLSGTAIESLMGGIGVPVISTANACATGTATLSVACLAVASGEYDVALAVASDKSAGGFFRPQSRDAKFDLDYQRYIMTGETNPAYWGIEVRRRMHDVGTTEEDLAKIKVLLSKAGAKNPLARYKKTYTIEDVFKSPMVCDPLHLLEICAVSDGAGAIIVTSLDNAKKYTDKPVLVEGVSVGTSSFGDQTIPLYNLSGNPREGVPILTESRNALAHVSKMAKAQYNRNIPEDIDVIELPDNTSWHYLVYLDCILDLLPGEAEKMVRNNETDPIDGSMPVCPSGGLSSCGEAVAAQGIYQLNAAVDQLKGEGGEAQVKKDVNVVLAQTYGYAGNNAACILSKAW